MSTVERSPSPHAHRVTGFNFAKKAALGTEAAAKAKVTGAVGNNRADEVLRRYSWEDPETTTRAAQR